MNLFDHFFQWNVIDSGILDHSTDSSSIMEVFSTPTKCLLLNGCLSADTDPKIHKKILFNTTNFSQSRTFSWLALVHQHTNRKDDKGEEIHSQVSAEINAIENMLLTVLFSGMSPTFEYLRTHRFVNKDSYLKLVAV